MPLKLDVGRVGAVTQIGPPSQAATCGETPAANTLSRRLRSSIRSGVALSAGMSSSRRSPGTQFSSVCPRSHPSNSACKPCSPSTAPESGLLAQGAVPSALEPKDKAAAELFLSRWLVAAMELGLQLPPLMRFAISAWPTLRLWVEQRPTAAPTGSQSAAYSPLVVGDWLQLPWRQ